MDAHEQVARFVAVFDRMRRLATESNPLQHAEVSVSMPQLTMLEWVAAHPACQLREMADGLDVTMPTISVGSRRLEDAGLLTRLPDPADGRAVRLELTPLGQRLVLEAHEFRMKKMGGLLSGLRSSEQESLLNLLERAVKIAESQQKSQNASET